MTSRPRASDFVLFRRRLAVGTWVHAPTVHNRLPENIRLIQGRVLSLTASSSRQRRTTSRAV